MLNSRRFFPRGRHVLVTWLAATSLSLVGFAPPAGSQPAPSVAGSFNDTPAVVREGVWYLRRSSSGGIAHDHFRYGNPGDTPFMGDWNGDGTDTPGVVRGNTWFLRNSNTSGVAEVSFRYGNAGDVPVVGDWNGDGADTPGVVRGNTWFLRNSNTTGVADVTFRYGNVGDVPVFGDWNGDALQTPGVVRGYTWFLRNSNTTGVADVSFGYGNAGDVPLSWQEGLAISCVNPDDGYQVGYPVDWHTNSANGLPPCSVFDPDPIDLEPGTEVPFSIAVVIRVEDVAFEVVSNPDPQHDRVIQRDGPLVIAGRNAVLLETEATGEDGLRPEGLLSYRYVVDLNGRSLVAVTYDAGDNPYDHKKQVLDRMIDTLSLQ